MIDELESYWQSESYKAMIALGFRKTAKEYVAKHGTVQPDGWIKFQDGSKFNTANYGTINPGDTIIK